MKKIYDLEERLIGFASEIILFAEQLPNSFAGVHLGGQLIRSGTSPALHYGESKAAESKKDFIHKMKVCLKELRESYNCLRLLKQARICQSDKRTHLLITEANELISIFVKSINTATKGD